ncbi:hydroxypyruvate reductase [Azospirillum agricola]|uniref:glycerate kinase type-2 family protein n=1 Tax=Azospirillum agricola TaxID=1720247 RepID=UPI001AE347A8|nr:glycerate kinase [Azospirillum agricola]MBP2230968.1 hydroxypyruvate reductase [Azospirillum agricola]
MIPLPDRDDGARRFLRGCFDRAVEVCRPDRILGGHLPPPPAGRTVVVGAGKAAASMAAALEAHWPGPLDGLVITRHGHGHPCARIRVVEAGHPDPDAEGERAAAELLRLVDGLGPDDLVLCLLSGGGSSLMMLPPDGLTLAEVKAVNGALLRSGAPIGDMNRVRSVLSRLGGGRLAVAAWPAPVVTLAISDVPGDEPATIASGPTVPPVSSPALAHAVLDRYRIPVPERLAAFLASDAARPPAADHHAFGAGRFHLMASGLSALNAAAEAARTAGIEPLVLGDAIEGEARQVGTVMAGIARSIRQGGTTASRPCLLLSGGETSVTVAGQGRGGRNAEFLLSFALGIQEVEGIAAIACDTDGIDGSETNAGALADGATAGRARAAGLDPADRLGDNDAYTVFAALGDLVVTGPTLTNVNDFRAVLIR